MEITRILGVAGLWFALSIAAEAASFSHASESIVLPDAAAPAGGTCGTEFLSQSNSQVITADNSVSCNIGGTVHVENSYYRAYDIASFPAGFDLCAVEIGIQSAVGAAGAQPISLRLYANTGGAFPAGTATLLSSRSITVLDQAASILTVPVSATVPSGAELIVEVLTPDGQAAGHSFLMGSNALGETGASLLRAPGCGVAAPTSTVASGFPNMQIVLNARGDAAAGAPMVAANPTPMDFGVVPIGASATRVVNLTNPGTAPLGITSIALPPLPFELVADTCTGGTLAPAMSCTLTYSFSPLATNSVSTSLLIASNANATTIDLRGTGTLPIPLPGPSGWLLAVLLLACLAAAAVVFNSGRSTHSFV